MCQFYAWQCNCSGNNGFSIQASLKWSASSRWLFGPNSAQGSIELVTIENAHPTLWNSHCTNENWLKTWKALFHLWSNHHLELVVLFMHYWNIISSSVTMMLSVVILLFQLLFLHINVPFYQFQTNQNSMMLLVNLSDKWKNLPCLIKLTNQLVRIWLHLTLFEPFDLIWPHVT